MDNMHNPEQSPQKRADRRDLAAATFPDLRRRAAEYGITLAKRSDAHYQLSHVDRDWLLNIYPGNRRLYWDPQKKGRFLGVKENWTLADVVGLVIKREENLEALVEKLRS